MFLRRKTKKARGVDYSDWHLCGSRRLQIQAARKTQLVHLKINTVLQSHALLRGFDGLPTFGSEPGNDLRGGMNGRGSACQSRSAADAREEFMAARWSW